MSTVIKVENISKQYRLGDVGTGTLSHDLKRWWYKARGKEDPYLQVGQTNDRSSKGNSEYVWALKDINFEVKAGEVLGIIGRNGAGKSTLLKILSKTTTPTTGNIKVRGRIASLLEVGTGFHPELTGRENIYLNGAILGMTKREIQKKFDEIVDFSGVERYIDTPVKRYSSGMYVRLAFAVAAHLEPEILIVDEVLAVGDAEFQKKCLGKMKDVSVNEGRTVLFVSHNMAAVNNLCNRGILLSKGILKYDIDNVNELTSLYLASTYNKVKSEWTNQNINIKESIQILNAKLLDHNGSLKDVFDIAEVVTVSISYNVMDAFIKNAVIAVNIHGNDGIHLLSIEDIDSNRELLIDRKVGLYSLLIKIPRNLLNRGQYYIRIGCGIINSRNIQDIEALTLTIENLYQDPLLNSHRGGFIYPKTEIITLYESEK